MTTCLSFDTPDKQHACLIGSMSNDTLGMVWDLLDHLGSLRMVWDVFHHLTSFGFFLIVFILWNRLGSLRMPFNHFGSFKIFFCFRIRTFGIRWIIWDLLVHLTGFRIFWIFGIVWDLLDRQILK